MSYTYIIHKKSMTSTGFSYRSCLNLVKKENLRNIGSIFSLSFGKSASKVSMVDVLDGYVKANPKAVLGKLSLKELELVKECIKTGANSPVSKAPRKTNDMIKMLLLVSVFYDKKTRKDKMLMADELRDLFAPHIDAALKEERKKERVRKMISEDIAYSYGDYKDFDDNFDDYSDTDFDDSLVDDIEDLDVVPMGESKYYCASHLIEDVRKLNYKQQAKILNVFYKLLKATKNWSQAFFAERFYETFENITFKDGEISDNDMDDLFGGLSAYDSIEWLGFAENDFANIITDIDLNDPMTFFDISSKMEAYIKELSDK